MIEYENNDARKDAEIKDLQPSPGEGVVGGGTANPLVTETEDVGRGTPIDILTPDQEGIKVERNPVNFVGGIKIKGKEVEDYFDSHGGVTEEELQEALLNKSNATNLENGSGTNSIQMKQDGTSGTFDFTNKNPNATIADPTLTGNIAYGGTGAFATVFGGKAAAIGKRSLAHGTTTIAKGNYSHAEGDNSVALGNDSHAEGYATLSQGRVSHSEGNSTISQGAYSHAEGIQTKAIGEESHSEGLRTEAGGLASHSEGIDTKSAALGSHSEGSNTQIKNAIPSGGGGGGGGDTPLPDPSWSADDHIGEYAHTEGGSTIAYGYCAHAEGFGNVAFGHYSHAEGWHTTAGAVDSSNNKLLGYGAHAEGRETKALADYSHAEGYRTIANYQYQTVVGTYNENKSDTLFEVGNGENGNTSNAFEVYKDGTLGIPNFDSNGNKIGMKKIKCVNGVLTVID